MSDEILLRKIKELAAAKKWQEASVYSRQLLERATLSLPLAVYIGSIFFEAGEFRITVQIMQRILQSEYEQLDAHLLLVKALWHNDEKEAALRACGQLLQNHPQCFEAWLFRGTASKAIGNLDTALHCYAQAARLGGNNAALWHNYGNALEASEQWPEAEQCFRRAIQLAPTFYPSYQNLGRLLDRLNRQEEAIPFYEKAIQLAPQELANQFNLAQSLLQIGELSRGFSFYESRLSWYSENYQYLKQLLRWDGRLFTGKKLLVCCEQGFGDALQFVRYLQDVKPLGGHITLLTPKPLERLLGTLTCADAVAAEVDMSEYDYCIPLLSLPYLFGTTLATIPAYSPYLAIPEPLVKSWRQRIAQPQRFKVGVVWSGKLDAFPEKSMRLSDIKELFQLTNILFINLQKDEAIMPLPENVMDLSGELTDFLETAAIIANLDAVVTVDTAVAHLAGAMGKKTLLLLPFKAEWRWLRERGDTPWYPSMQLIRQRRSGDWLTVLAQAREWLCAQKRKV